MSVLWLFLLCGWLILWAAMGGLTILHYYILRLLLARNHTFPLRARRFLDDATARVLLQRQGGGYGFVHRSLLDFLADTAFLSTSMAVRRFRTDRPNTSDAVYQASAEPQNASVLLPGTAPSEDLQH